MSEVRTISPWWGLLVLPLGVVGGWAVGKFSDPKPRTVEVATGWGGPPVRVSVTSASEHPGTREQPAPNAPGKPGEFSAWTTFDQAISESARNGKPILLDFNAEWCPPCQALKQSVFEDASYSNTVQTAVIPVSIVDRSREDGQNPPQIDELQSRFRVEAFPTLVVFHPKSGKMEQTRGFGGAELTTEWIVQAAKKVR